MKKIDTYVESVRKATDENQHTLALRFIAEYVKSKDPSCDYVRKLIKACDAIEVLHDLHGHLTPRLSSERNELHNSIFCMMPLDECRKFEKVM